MLFLKSRLDQNDRIIMPEYTQSPPYGRGTMAWMTFFLRPYKWRLIGYYFLGMIRQSSFRAQPLFLGLAIGLVESGVAARDPAQLVALFAGYVAMLATAFLAISLIIPAMAVFDKISKDLSLYSLRHYLNLPESWHEENSSGEKLQRLSYGRQSMLEILEQGFWHLVLIPGIIIVIFSGLYVLDAPWYYAALYIGFFVTYLPIGFLTTTWLQKKFEAKNESLERVFGGVYEFIVSTSTVKFFNLRRYVMQKGETIEAPDHLNSRAQYITVVKRWITMDFLALFWVVCIIVLSSYQVIHGSLSIGAYTSILFFNLMLWGELDHFTQMTKELIKRWEGLKRLFEILDQRPAIEDAIDATQLDVRSPDIQFDHVSFDYNEKKQILSEVNFSIPAGQKVGILGPSGAGKSTLVKLLLRFYDVDQGALKISDTDIRNVTQSSLQRAIAVIPQDVTLFNHPLIENIRYGRLDASDEEVFEAARKANAHDFILDLPDGYDTIVGERGVKLSGGQRQRIAIARAILKDAPILILDEATSALDSESEQLIQKSLENLMDGKTVIAIAHRLSTIANLDRLLVMQDGKIIQDGTHLDLLKNRKGLYATLWDMQSGGFIKDKSFTQDQ